MLIVVTNFKLVWKFGSFHTVVLLSLISIMTVKHNNGFFINLLFCKLQDVLI